MKTRTRAFTLIELLIVVLIIAILAAIAVPNFLEFQTRAKVSRIHSDMRTLATAIEAYYVDNNDYPIGIVNGAVLGLWTRNSITDDMNPLYKFITTPITYISTPPSDPFTEDIGSITRKSDYFWYDDTNYPNNTYFRPAFESGFEWVLRSWGPTRKNNGGPWPNAILNDGLVINIYDPTNGTISPGFILRTNKGIYPNS